MRNFRTAEIFGLKRRPIQNLQGSPTDKRWYLLSVFLLILSIPLHQPLLLLVGILLLLILAITDVWALYCFSDLHYQRQFSEQHALFGEEVTLSLFVENAKLLPLPWLEIEDTIPRLLPIKGVKLYGGLRNDLVALECLFSLRWYERITRRYTIQCNARGVHTFGPTKLSSGDVFGFISREMELSNYQYLLVYPLIAPLHSFGLPARHPFGDRRTPLRLLEDPSRIVGVRDYAYGDSLRRVNWKATARTMTMQSNIYESTTTHSLVLFLNIIAQLDIYYGVRPDLQELSICATASVADWALDQGYAVGLYSNTTLFIPDEEPSILTSQDENTRESNQEKITTARTKRRRIRLSATSHGEQRQRIMETLARVQSFFSSPIEDILQIERTHLPAGATIVIVTSTISEQLIDVLNSIRQHGHSITILFASDSPPPLKLGTITTYHLGGETAWKELVSTYTKASDHPALPYNPGFRL
ncbi:MAG: DUF58 domain-containing protein [Ktedonobacteraceae bacterium]|nr:DUF58 domain-containing protein [Ktedonobacteraceae bacterium]